MGSRIPASPCLASHCLTVTQARALCQEALAPLARCGADGGRRPRNGDSCKSQATAAGAETASSRRYQSLVKTRVLARAGHRRSSVPSPAALAIPCKMAPRACPPQTRSRAPAQGTGAHPRSLLRDHRKQDVGRAKLVMVDGLLRRDEFRRGLVVRAGVQVA